MAIIIIMQDKYEAEVLDYLEEVGFTDFQTEPIETDHPANCNYDPDQN